MLQWLAFQPMHFMESDDPYRALHEERLKTEEQAKCAFVNTMKAALSERRKDDEPWQAAIRLMQWRHLDVAIVSKRIDEPAIPGRIVTVPSVLFAIDVAKKFTFPREVHSINHAAAHEDVARSINGLSQTFQRALADVFLAETYAYWDSINENKGKRVHHADPATLCTEPKRNDSYRVYSAMWEGNVPLQPDEEA